MNDGDEEVTVTMSRKLWVDLLVDLDWAAQELGELAGVPWGMVVASVGLEPGSLTLRELLERQGVTI